MRLNSVAESAKIASLILLPLIIPVYIHDYLFHYFIIRKQYILYGLTTASIVAFFGYIIGEFQYYLDPNGSSETYGALLIMMILFTGAKYFMAGATQQIKLKEEEKKRIKAEIELKELEHKQSQAELNLLKSQVNPHFLFNSLNSIYSLILSNSDIAADTVMKLSDLMRYLLESSKKKKVLVTSEFDFLQNYIDLEVIRLGKKAKVICNFSGELGGKIISPLLLIPFVENCFKHGIGVSSKDNIIDISVAMVDDTIVLKTKNNIAPQRINPATKKSGTGIDNVKKRLELLYPNKYTLDIKQSDNEYSVNFTLSI
jgi:LytS/YehU family sensor histidine kinase